HRQDIGPWAIAGGIALAAVACLVWVTRTAASFSWGAVPSPNVAFDYVLLLGLLLFASDLAYVEVEFTLLGPKWPHHLLVVGLVSGGFGSELDWGVWLAALLVVAGLVMWLSFPLGRSLYFAQGIVAVYVGLLRLLFEPFRHHVSGLPFFLAAVLGLGALVLILAAHRRMRER